MLIDRRSGDVELGDYLAKFRRRWAWVLLPLIMFPLLAGLLTSRQPLRYQSTARVLLDASAAYDVISGGGTTNQIVQERDLANEINVAESDRTKSLVRQRLGLGPDETLPNGTISADSASDLLSFTFEGSTPDEAAELANTWASVYVEVKQIESLASIESAVGLLQSRLESLQTEREEIRTELEALEDRLARTTDAEAQALLQLQVDRENSAISGELSLVDAQIAANIESITELQLSGELASVGNFRIVQVAAPPVAATNVSLSLVLVVASVIGGLAGIAIALLVDNLDHSISSAQDVERLGLTVLGVVPAAPRRLSTIELATIAHTQPGTPLADGYQKVRTALQYATLGNDIKSILVTSPGQGEGKTTTAVNLALAYANVENRVVLADVDFRRPSIHTVFNIDPVPGISDTFQGKIPLQQTAVSHPELSSTLLAVPAGTRPSNPAALLSSSLVSKMLAGLRTHADLTILDAPPVLTVADALSVVSHTDGVVVVVRAGSTTKEELANAIDAITRSGGNVLGVVVNRANTRNVPYGFAARGAAKDQTFEVESKEPAGPPDLATERQSDLSVGRRTISTES